MYGEKMNEEESEFLRIFEGFLYFVEKAHWAYSFSRSEPEPCEEHVAMDRADQWLDLAEKFLTGHYEWTETE